MASEHQFRSAVRSITLFIFGGVAELSQEPPSAKAEFFVAIAGPIVSVLVGIACYAMAIVGELLEPCANENTTERSADAMQTLSRMNQGSVSRLMG